MLKHVLVPLDTSELAERALQHARELVEPGGMITLICVVTDPIPERYVEAHTNDPFLWSEYGHIDADTLHRSLIDRAEAYLRGQAAALMMRGYMTRMVAVCGDAAELILETAQQVGAEAIVMSTHGRSGINKVIYGSVTQKVLHTAPCPVFVVPMKAA